MPKEKSPRSSEGSFRSMLRSAFRTTISTVFLFVGVFVIMNIYQTGQQTTQVCDEQSIALGDSEDRRHYRAWKSLSGGHHCVDYESRAAVSDGFFDKRLNLPRPHDPNLSDEAFWGYIYQQLLLQNQDQVDFIADSLISIGQQKSLSRYDLAALMVTFVQDIPYVLISSTTCEADYEGPCRGDEPFGILSPYEFLHSLQGDCDTCSVLLYALLKKAGFKPLIVVSEEYAHAMIALDVATTGDYISYQRQKYFFWETTSHGWKPGMLPPSTNNVQYWKIALAHEF